MNSLALDLCTPPNHSVQTDTSRTFEHIVSTHSQSLFKYAYWLCGDRETAADLVQETLLRAWRSLDRLEQPQAARSWLFTIIRRENARRFERVQPDWSEQEPETLPATWRQHDDSVEAFNLRRALAALSDEYREPLLLQVIGGYNYEEIAKRLGLSKSAVTSRLYRARQRLYTALTGEQV